MSMPVGGGNGGSSKGALGKSSSLPSISGGRYSPFFDKQTLCTVEIRHRRMLKEAVGDHQGSGMHSVKLLNRKKMGFMASERGLEWERGHAKAQIAPDALPPVNEVIALAIEELALEFPPRNNSVSLERESKRDPSFGGSGLHRCGPKLPLGRPRPDLDLNTPPPSPPPPPKEPKEKKKKKITPNKDAISVAFAESVLKKIAEPPPPEPEEVVVVVHIPKDDHHNIDIPWSEEELRSVFYKFDSDRDNELEVEDLTPLLRYIGAKPKDEDVSKIIKELTHYATIEWEEFLEFIRRYREHDLALLRKSFKETDTDGSGKLNAAEIELLLRKLGYAATVQTVHEAMDEVDQDKSGDIGFKEFEELRQYLVKSEGFVKADIQDISNLYKRAAGAGGKEHELNTEEIWRITMFRGYANTAQEIAQIAAEVDADGTGTVSFPELLKVIRRVREIERESVIKVLRKHGDLHGSKLAVADLGIALTDLGYYVSEEAIFEILDTFCPDCESDEYLTLEELMSFLRGYRRTEGFSEAEMKELEESFTAEDTGKTNSINALELGRVLRSFGFAKTLQKVQRLVEEIDFDGSGELEMNEFIKLMRQLLQGEAKKRREVFDLLDPGRTGQIPVEMLKKAVTILDEVEPDKNLLKAAFKAATPEGSSQLSMGMGSFELFYKHYRRALVQEIRKNAGYSPKEIMQLQQIFANYDKDKSGTIERVELQKMIATYFPDATKSRAQQIEIQNILASFDTGAKTGELDFHKFVWLMRKCDDMRDEADVKMEAEIVKECSLSVEEVEGFRQIFSCAVNWTGELDVESLQELLLKVVDLNDDHAEELGNLVRQVHPHGRNVARFPQFIKLIKKITEEDLLGVNEAANRSLRRASMRRQRTATVKLKDTSKESKVKESQVTIESDK